MTTGKTIPLTRQTFVGKVMSLLFNMLSRLVITKCSQAIITWNLEVITSNDNLAPFNSGDLEKAFNIKEF